MSGDTDFEYLIVDSTIVRHYEISSTEPVSISQTKGAAGLLAVFAFCREIVMFAH
jgi:hypothetical protein